MCTLCLSPKAQCKVGDYRSRVTLTCLTPANVASGSVTVKLGVVSGKLLRWKRIRYDRRSKLKCFTLYTYNGSGNRFCLRGVLWAPARRREVDIPLRAIVRIVSQIIRECNKNQSVACRLLSSTVSHRQLCEFWFNCSTRLQERLLLISYPVISPVLALYRLGLDLERMFYYNSAY